MDVFSSTKVLGEKESAAHGRDGTVPGKWSLFVTTIDNFIENNTEKTCNCKKQALVMAKGSNVSWALLLQAIV